MILVADSGSTKCDWILIDDNNLQYKTNTMGFNPFFHSAELVNDKLLENVLLTKYREDVKNIYFYGAGCSSPARTKIISTGLISVFPNAKNILVDHDLTGAALATTEGAEGIACILGTGSNSCYFDGSKSREEVPALGYILGDEGSGSFFGKIFLSDWLYKRMPSDLHQKFGEEYNLTKEGIFESVHHKPNPNVYLASFMPFASAHSDHPYIKDIIYQGLAKFINIHVWCYPNFREIPIHFVGSIAYYFKDVLEEVARNHRFTVGKIEKRPIEPLATFHYNQNKKQNESESVHI